jgi:transcriptional antiterminator RfaH
MEQFLAGQLESRQIPFYLPQLKVTPSNPRCKKNKPFFPGYLFIQENAINENAIKYQRLPGAAGLVSFGGEIAFVPGSVLNAIRQNVERMNRCAKDPLFGVRKGDRVTIKSGAFEGYEAVFDSCSDSRERARVFLSMVEKRMLEVELPAAYLA